MMLFAPTGPPPLSPAHSSERRPSTKVRNSCASCWRRDANCSPTFHTTCTISCGEMHAYRPLHSTRSSACTALVTCASSLGSASACCFHAGVFIRWMRTLPNVIGAMALT
eukprot:scaffold3177_cov86-Phaeocystis_antarctica.AAC.1